MNQALNNDGRFVSVCEDRERSVWLTRMAVQTERSTRLGTLDKSGAKGDENPFRLPLGNDIVTLRALEQESRKQVRFERVCASVLGLFKIQEHNLPPRFAKSLISLLSGTRNDDEYELDREDCFSTPEDTANTTCSGQRF